MGEVSVFNVVLTYTLQNGGVDEFLKFIKYQSTIHRSHRSCLCFSGSSSDAGFEMGEFSKVIAIGSKAEKLEGARRCYLKIKLTGLSLNVFRKNFISLGFRKPLLYIIKKHYQFLFLDVIFWLITIKMRSLLSNFSTYISRHQHLAPKAWREIEIDIDRFLRYCYSYC